MGKKGGDNLESSGRILQAVGIFYILNHFHPYHQQFLDLSNSFKILIILSMNQILPSVIIELNDQDTPSKAMKIINANFYEFLLHKMTRSEINKEETLYYSRFLKSEFTKFKVGRGYPIINKKCETAQCYFFIRFEKKQDYQHPFLKLLSEGITYSCPVCKRKFSADYDEFIHDAGLAGFLQHKLKDDELRYITEVEITKNNDIYIPQQGEIYEMMNRIRLDEISRVAPDLTQTPDNEEHLNSTSRLRLIKKESDSSENIESSGQEQKSEYIKDQKSFFEEKREKGPTLKVNTEQILNNIRNSMLESPFFVGGKFSIPEVELKAQNFNRIVLPVVHLDKKNGRIILYHQDSLSNSFLPSIPICKNEESHQNQTEKNIDNKNVYYYDGHTMKIYVLYSKQIYFCDLRYMYNAVKGCFNLQFLCRLTQIEEIKPQTTRIIVRQSRMYIFIGKSKNFINVYKAKLPQKLSDEVDVPAEAILENKFRNRIGFNLSFVPAKHLTHEECIILFGGVIQKMPTIKLLEIMLLPNNAPEKYLYHKISLVNQDNDFLNQRNPTFAIYRQNLVVWGGILTSQKHQITHARHLAIVPLKEQAVSIAMKELIDENQKDNIVDAGSFGAVYLGNRISKDDSGWLVMMKGLHKLGKVNVIRLNEQNGVFRVESLRNSLDI